jgi:asparagine synthetase B (glutamine-hydrolysing)
MCGIAGIVIKKNTSLEHSQLTTLLRQLLIYSEARGKESTGLVIKDRKKKALIVLRKTIKAKEFIQSDEYNKLINKQVTEEQVRNGISILLHTRIATNGSLIFDNQPIIKNNTVGVHNGIICNIEDLWKKYPQLNRKQEIDTELLIGLIRSKIDEREGEDIAPILFDIESEIEGTASFGLLFDCYDSMLIGSNCGSLHYFGDEEKFVFASENYILNSSLSKTFDDKDFSQRIKKLQPVSFGLISEKTLEFQVVTKKNATIKVEKHDCYSIVDITDEKNLNPFFNNHKESHIRKLLEYNVDAVNNIKRCTKCLLTVTHPFIEFDIEGVCNYCRDYEKKRVGKIENGREALEKELESIRKIKGDNCIVLLSGGRDSCYALHLVKEELGLNPIAYSYDWGMLTDLGRRNQYRMCQKLGVEHIIVSADIAMKRRNIKLNVEAFLAKPHLGLIGLFMAGDKAYSYHARMLRDRFKLKLIGGGCPYEYTYFKEGFTGLAPYFVRKRNIWDRFSLARFFALQALSNPRLINISVFDTLKSFNYYYLNAVNEISLFRYLPWEEKTVNEMLTEKYNWELSPDTSTTWRIGDGTAAFYNYIYCTVAGFTENDVLRSNQINEGIIDREKALMLVLNENKPRYESLKWYCDTIGIDLEFAITQINKIPKLYTN